ncbi:hypothetical protein CQW23_12767 [Capsicum baccatum]|uniref:Ubiquitin-like protease family profile domain-containing protein n=1 Tax=Capsicum baccatum TaxID=33114 RepID=A0A2G2WTR1_CAPBA|nr:hypothetical protein CQW23_12767 [Capsicum baccatum]
MAEELDKLDFSIISFASDHPGTSSMPSSTGNPDKRSYQENVAKQSPKEGQSSEDVAIFEGYSNPIRPHFVMEKIEEMKHVDVIMYYLQKKYKNKNFPVNRYTTIDCFFKVFIDKAYVNYYEADVGKNLATQDASAKTDEVADMEMSLINTINGLSPRVGQPWHLVNEVLVPINYDGAFHWVLAVIALKDRCIYVYDSMASSWKRLQTTVYAKYLSEGLGIPPLGMDAQYHRLRYASLCKYGFEKAEHGYFSENDNPPRPRSKFAPKETYCVLHIH